MLLNMKSSNHQIPDSQSRFYTIQLSRVHILERDHYPDTLNLFKDLEVRTCCGLTVRSVIPGTYSLLNWEILVALTQDRPVETVLRRFEQEKLACLACDRIFNQSEVAC